MGKAGGCITWDLGDPTAWRFSGKNSKIRYMICVLAAHNLSLKVKSSFVLQQLWEPKHETKARNIAQSSPTTERGCGDEASLKDPHER